MRTCPVVFNLGFRIFFMSASIFSVISMAMWLATFSLAVPLSTGRSLSLLYWHGHEMVFGYAMAVVAGFLLTVVQNWTGLVMPSGARLMLIWLPWLIARLIYGLYLTADMHLSKSVIVFSQYYC